MTKQKVTETIIKKWDTSKYMQSISYMYFDISCVFLVCYHLLHQKNNFQINLDELR